MRDKVDIERVKADSERCVEIFLGERSSCECSLCPYRQFGSSCILKLLEAQNKAIEILTESEDTK